MATRKKPKHPSVDVSGHVPVQDQPAGWELDLMVEAFSRLRSPGQPRDNEGAGATITKPESTHVAA
jgi:hypothetical protein